MNALRFHCCLFVMVYFKLSLSLAPHELTFLIISQKNAFSAKLANELKSSILNQVQIDAFLNNNEIDAVQQPKIILSHESFDSIGSWAITPILASTPEHIEHTLLRSVSTDNRNDDKRSSSSIANHSTANARMSQTKWIILCEDQSIVDLKALINNLQYEDYTKDIYLGYPLHDSEATIIHHFAFFENPSWFLYPLFRAGVAISIPLLKKLVERIRTDKNVSEFFIDASHELSLFAWNRGNGHKLTEAPYFCAERKSSDKGNGCAIYSRISDVGAGSYADSRVCGDDTSVCPSTTATRPTTKSESFNTSVSVQHVFFAVKTWSQNHVERLPIIQRTWARDTKFIRYFSDASDASIPTVSTNVENTETGHCTKTLAILRQIIAEITKTSSLRHIKWIVLTDDDTLLSVRTLLQYLRRFNPNDNVYLGERYGYQLLSPNGFNYITGGGGIVFSLNVVEKLVQSCTCPTPSSPDDMIIALCLQRIGIEPIHSSRFHQARSIDYPEELLLHNKPISFHKFWQINPFEVYERWLDGNRIPRSSEASKYIEVESNYCIRNQNDVQKESCEN